MKKHEIRKTLLGILFVTIGGVLSLVHAVPFNGCPDFMDITASYVECYSGMTDHPFDSLGLSPNRHHLNEEQGYDPRTGDKLKLIPDGEEKSIRLGNNQIGGESEAIVYHYIVDPDNSLLFVNFAVVMEDPGHEFAFQPRFVIRVTDKNGKLVNDCSVYDVTAAAGLEGFQDFSYSEGGEYHVVRWRDWSKIGLDLTPFIGQEVQVQFITYDCFLFGHYGYAYFTASCAPNKLSLDVCEGASYSLAAPEGFPSYRWDNGDTSRISTRTYQGGEANIFCEITSATGCQFIQSAYVSDAYSPEETDILDTICQGESYQRHNFNLPPQMSVGTFGFNNLIANPATCSATANVNLKLTVLQTYFPIDVSICEGEDYVENGFNVIQPPTGVLTDTLRFERGKSRQCDSIVCLRLVVNDTKNLSNELKGDLHPCTNQVVTYTSELEDNLSSYKWDLPKNVKVVSGEHSPQIALYFTSDEPATLTLIGENGCGTSASPYTIYPYPSYHEVISDTICVGESYKNGSIDLGKQEEPGVYTSTHSFKTSKGCDSVVVLQLMVLPIPQLTFEVSPDKKIHCDSSLIRLSVKTSTGTLIYHPCPVPAVSLGDVYCSDGTFVNIDSFPSSGKEAEGVVFHYDDTSGYAYVVSLYEPVGNMPWSIVDYDIPGLENQQYIPPLLDDMDGFGHTSLIRAAGDSSEYPLAWSADFERGWYIPAIGELRKMFGAIGLVNKSLKELQGDTIFHNQYGSAADRNFYYYSSSENSAEAVCCVRFNFYVCAMYKGYSLTTRYARKIKLKEWTQPQYKTGDLIVNKDGSKGVFLCASPDGKIGTMVALEPIDSIAIKNDMNDIEDTLLMHYDDRLCTSRGYRCTQRYRELGDSTEYPAAWAVDLENGWYIPTRAEMNLYYSNLPLLDSIIYINGGTPSHNRREETFWTCDLSPISRGYSINIPFGDFDDAYLFDLLSVRPMRQFTICEDYSEYKDTTLSFKWNNGATTSSITDYPTQTTRYEVTLLSNEGRCTSKHDTTVYVQSIEPIVLDRQICHGQTYKDDYFEASETGTYHTEVDNGECTQKITLNLTVLDAQDTTHVRDVVCQGTFYRKHGFMFQATTPGIQFDTVSLSDGNGCDSTICLELEVLPAQRDTQYARVCQNESYFKNGFEIPAYQRAGLQYKERSEINDEGCTYIHVLALMVDTVYQIAMVDSICHMGHYQRNGFDFVAEEEGYSVHYQTLTSSTHCDSVIALSIKTFPRTSYSYSDTILYGDTYRDQNFDLPAQKVAGLHTFDTIYSNVKGCDSTVTLLLYVRNEDDVDIPTSFTPKDGNGINDRFMEGYEVYIHDRYGLLVCHSDNGWDGKYRGEPADAGVYLYTIRFRNGKEKRGTIEIIKE